MTTRVAAPPAATAFARGPFTAGGVVILDAAEAHHLRVRRIPDGATVRLVDGRGAVATARLALEREVVAARVVAATTVAPPPVTELLVGAGDRDRFLLLVEKATELGATRLVPVVTERAIQVASRFQAPHVEKAVLRAREALKQCGGAWVPGVVSPLALSEAVRAAPAGTLRLVADAEGGPLPMIREADQVQWLIGPEGGLSEAETSAVRSAGFRPVALGRATLRFDTAALAALALTAQARLGAPVHGGVA
jgi:16S rRNA (uracil1498-N3)-methyltransferase